MAYVHFTMNYYDLDTHKTGKSSQSDYIQV